MSHDTRDLEIATHTALTVLHGLAVLFHLRRRAPLLAALHAFGVAADGYALIHHMRHVPKAGTVVPDLGKLRELGL